MKMHIRYVLITLGLGVLAPVAFTAEAYFSMPVASLKFMEGTLPSGHRPPDSRRWQTWTAMYPYAILDGEGEVYVSGESFNPWTPPDRLYQTQTIAVRAPADKEVAGRLFVPKADWSGMVPLRFKLEPALAKAEARPEFFKAKESYYRRLLERNVPGGAWFRHQEREAAKERGAKATEGPANPNRFGRGRPLDVEDTYDLFSGGRAVSENLQLDRLLAVARTGTSTVPLASLQGVSVREMDWKPLIKDVKPTLDALAAFIPFDQHALFFPSFSAMTDLIDEGDTEATPVLQLLEPRSEDANSRSRYQKQLCLEINELSRLLGPQLISSVAFTGSDPYLRMGTDVGILFETKSPGVLKTFLLAKLSALTKTNLAIKSVQGEMEGVSYTGAVTKDRSICSYVAALDEVVFVSNSLYQLRCLVQAAKGKKPSLAAQDEYAFFRTRYAKSATGETAFLILTDATIRRWCSPQWRIADSRRTWAQAALAELHAQHLGEWVAGTAQAGPVKTDLILPDAGEFQLTSEGLVSPVYGTLAFMTPIAELSLTNVTQAEAEAYNRWREGYQQNWRQYFDPIAVRFSMTARQLSAELTVMPLIAGSDYRRFINLSSGGRILAGAGDPHPEALMHLAMSINPESELIKGAGNFLGTMNPSLRANPLGWLGQSIAIYADQDPFWDRLAKTENSSEFLRTNYHQLPLALHCEAKNSLGLAAFLASVRAFIEQTAPKMTVWQSSEYKGQAYVKVASVPEAGAGELANLAVYYAVTPRSLVLTLSEPLLQRTLDRQSARLARKNEDTSDAGTKPWLGTNLCLQLEQKSLASLLTLFRDDYQTAQQLLSWNNLPILNEWKRLYPAQDPVKLHEQFWHMKLLCPAGGAYVWNEKWQTMESTVYGHPGEPKIGPGTFQPLAQMTGANLGLTFENQGLSAKAVLARDAKKP